MLRTGCPASQESSGTRAERHEKHSKIAVRVLFGLPPNLSRRCPKLLEVGFIEGRLHLTGIDSHQRHEGGRASAISPLDLGQRKPKMDASVGSSNSLQHAAVAVIIGRNMVAA
jgi:hypothetical protein